MLFINKNSALRGLILLTPWIPFSFLLSQKASAQESNDRTKSLKVKTKKSLPILKAKQSLSNVRFLSKDGKVTYYQTSSGELIVSKNYANQTLIKDKKHTHFELYVGAAKKKVVIEKNTAFLTNLSILRDNDLFIANYGEKEVTRFARGISPKLHLVDRFISYYRPRLRRIDIWDIELKRVKFSIELRNNFHPYFMPDVVMLNDYDVLYTNVNREGKQALLLYKHLEKKNSVIFKSQMSNSKVEFCIQQKSIVLGSFKALNSPGNSNLWKIPLFKNKDFRAKELIYESNLNDIGNIVCSENTVYFIKTLSYDRELMTQRTEVAAIDLRNSESQKQVKILSDLQFISHIVEMDQMIFAPFRGNIYIIKGTKELASDEIVKSVNLDDK